MAAGVNNLNPFSLDEVNPKQTWRFGSITSTFLVWTQWNQNNHGEGVNNLNPFSLDNQNKYGRRAHHLKPKLNTSYFFQDGRQSAIFKFLNLNF